MSDATEIPCTFCEIIAGRLPASIIARDDLALAFLDERQFHPGHVLVASRAHVADLRVADDRTLCAVMALVARVARALDATFPADGFSVWHSAGPGANQEVPHLHVHIHPRQIADGLLRVYPSPPAHPDRVVLDDWAARLTSALVSRGLS